jgi:hypothetical protein
MHPRAFALVIPALAIIGLAAGQTAYRSASSSQAKSLFENPPREFSSAPLWVWNDQLTESQVIDSLRELARQHVKQAFVHPRPGLMTPYLSPEWFSLWKAALREAERLDMNLWIYDENSYPSGFAGGLVPDDMAEARGRGLGMLELNQAPNWSDDIIAVFRLGQTGYENVTAKVRGGDKLPDDRYLVVSLIFAKPSPWYGGKTYVDLMKPGVTQKFLSLTMDAYRREIGDQFGKRVPGVFTDEPHIRPAGGLPWTDDLPQLFEKRWGYRLTDHLPALREPLGDWKRIRHNYLQLLLEQFIDRWARPYYEYCARNNVQFTGHYWEHEWPNCISVPDNMAMSAWQQRPGIDILMNQYHEDVHAQFGNVRAVKELASVANQLGRERTLCEAYGAGGWDLRFEDMKRIGDWLYVLGVNTLDQHLSYVSIRGARKRDHPQSFSRVEPWWESYHVSASYFARLSAALSRGEQINNLLLIEPTTTAWMYNAAGKNPPELEKVGAAFQKMVVDLEKAQVEFDLGCEDIIAHHGSVGGESLRVGQRTYRAVVLPPFTENLNTKTMELLEDFAKNGGTILSCGAPPARVDGCESSRGSALAAATGWKRVDVDAVPALLLAEEKGGFAIRRDAGDKGILFHHRRQLEDGQLLFLVNTSSEFASAGAVETVARGIERWDPETGRTAAYPFEITEGLDRARFELPPSGSLLLFLSNKYLDPEPQVTQKASLVKAEGPMEIRRAGPNVLVLDYVDVRAGGDDRKDSYFYQASQFAFQKNGMERNPWDSAVQFRDELISKKFPPQSGLEAVYHFTIRGRVPASLTLVVERPDLYSIECNGRPAAPEKDSWWLDKAFGKLDITAAAQLGENLVTLKASPFTVFHELESVYILGDFRLEPLEKGFAVAAEEPLKPGAWNEQGLPFYSEGVSYAQVFPLLKPSGQYRVSLRKWYGSIARVLVNGTEAGFIYAPPGELDVTRWIKPGSNRIEVMVIGTLKNTLGPHHGDPALGTAWPAMFQKGPYPGPPPGAKYSTVGYGLMMPFALVQYTR